MDNLIRKKIVLSLLDSDPKSANEIADEIDESLTTVEAQLTELVSDNLCEEVNHEEANHYAVQKDIETFAQLVNEFLSDKEEHKEQIEQFITSEYYFARIDFELVDYVLKRFFLDQAYQTDEEKEGIRRIFLVSPSALFFSLFEDTTRFGRMVSSSTHLDSSDETREWLTQILNSQFITLLSDNLIADMEIPVYCILYAKLGVRVALVQTQVKLATLQGKFVEAVGGGHFSLFQAAEDFQAGELTSAVDPMVFSYDGIALMHLGELQAALEKFDQALNAVQDPIKKAIVLNNKGLVFLTAKQYLRAIECFEKGIELDPEEQISVLRENKQKAEEWLAQATDRENLTQPTQIRFFHEKAVPFEETLFYEFKEIKGNSFNRITKDADEYTVAFLNREGGRIFWGIRNKDRITVGVKLNEEQRDDVRRIVSEKLWAIRPPISDEDWQLEFHQVYDLQGEIIENLRVIELLVPPHEEKEVFYTNSGELFVKTAGGKQKLLGPQITEFIRDRLRDDVETE